MNPDLIGYAAGALVSISLLPQILKSWKTKSTRDISVMWNVILLFGLFLWIAYGVRLHNAPIAIFAGIEAVLTASLLVLKLMYK